MIEVREPSEPMYPMDIAKELGIAEVEEGRDLERAYLRAMLQIASDQLTFARIRAAALWGWPMTDADEEHEIAELGLPVPWDSEYTARIFSLQAEKGIV